ncbi:MAG: CxxxxCH/CxxCH domain-containing protein [Candidatus Methanoperedens sp.]|nr:CxxxxCH/CxxCH domain-containing protein [Candidatus Methanoperedens sp.]
MREKADIEKKCSFNLIKILIFGILTLLLLSNLASAATVRYYMNTVNGVDIGVDGPTNVVSGTYVTIPPIITASMDTTGLDSGNARTGSTNSHPTGLYTHSRWYFTSDYSQPTQISANPAGSAYLRGASTSNTAIVRLYDYNPVSGTKTLIGSSQTITLTGGTTTTAYSYTISSSAYTVPQNHRLMLQYDFNQPGSTDIARVYASSTSAYIDIVETAQAVATYTISGYITNKSNGSALNGATVQTNTSQSTTTNAQGYYIFTNLSNGSYLINASLTGYATNSTTRTISGANLTNVNISLSPVPTYLLSGYVTNSSNGAAISGAIVTTNTSLNISTDGAGYYYFTVNNGTYIITASKTGYNPNSITKTVNGANQPNSNISITYMQPSSAGKILVSANRYVVLDDPKTGSFSGTGFKNPTNNWATDTITGVETTITMWAMLLDSNGKPLANKNVNFTLKNPVGTNDYTFTKATDSKGLVNVTRDLNNKNYYGKWQIVADFEGLNQSTSFIYNWWGCGGGAGCTGHSSQSWATGAAINSPYTTGHDGVVGARSTHYNTANDCMYCHLSYNGQGSTPSMNTSDRHSSISCTNSSCHGTITQHQTNMVIGSCSNCHNRTAITKKSTLNGILSNYSTTSTYHDQNASIPCIICHGPMHNITKPDPTVGMLNNVTEDSQCTTCHANYEQHKGSVNCTLCHSQDVHVIQVLSQSAGYVNKGSTYQGNCTNCHQNASFFNTLKLNPKAGPYSGPNPPQVQIPLNHSNDSSAGQKWNNYWTSGTGGSAQLTACNYCHGSTQHDLSALGRPAQFDGNNVVGSTISNTTYWCSSCHWQGYTSGANTYNDMVNIFNALRVPPEITGHATYGANQSKPGYFNHSSIAKDDASCQGCHGSLTSSTNITGLLHNVAQGLSGGPDCKSCHDIGGSAPKEVDINVLKNSTHRNLNQALTDVNKACYACHGDGTAPASGHPENYRNPKLCADCHTGAGNYSAPLVAEHNQVGQDVITNATCNTCHDNSGMFLPNAGTNGMTTAFVHYIKDVTNISTSPYQHFGPINTSNCIECHNNATYSNNASWGSPVNISTSIKRNHTETLTSQCDVCHKDSNVSSLAIVDFHNASVQGGSGSCTSCHSQPPSGTVRYNMTGAHDLHKSAGYGSIPETSCDYCHSTGGKNEAGHPNTNDNATVVTNASASIGTYNMNPASGNDDTCSGVSCHSNGLSSGAKVGIATWNTATAGACNECHSTVPSGLPPTGNHTRHYTTEGYSCAECHGTNADAGNQTGHKTNAVIDINFTNVTGSINASKTCSVYCHSPNPNDVKPKPTWNTSSVSCGDCHSIPPTITRNNVNHTTDTNCNGCHGANATLGTQTGHINGVIDTPTMSCISCHAQPPSGTTRYNMTGAHDLHKSKGYGTLENTSCQYCHNNAGGYEPGHPQNDGAADVAANASATMTYFQNLASGNDDTCSGVSCHSNGLSSGAKVGTATWNTATAGTCTECHSTVPSGLPPTGNHTRHYTTEGYSCAECHGTNADAGNQTGHKTNAVIDINFTNVTGSINASKTCSVYCHSPNPNDIKPKPTWNTSSVTCGDCHSIPPTAFTTRNNKTHTSDINCNGCHGANASAGTQIGHLNGVIDTPTMNCLSCHSQPPSGTERYNMTGAHDLHKSKGYGTLENTSCQYCHNNAGGYEPGHPQNDGAADVAANASATMTYFQNLASGNDDTCSGVSCHSNGLSSGAKVGTATWNTATAGTCTECHSTVPSGLPPTGNHTRHYTTEGYSCAECHGTNADAGNQTGHKTNAVIDINFTNVTGSINASKTCSVYCHSPNPNDVKPKPTWNTSSVTCGDCHSIPPTAFTTRNNKTHTSDTNCNGCHGANASTGTQIGHLNGVIDTPTMSCVSCHSQPPSGTVRYNMTGAHDLHKSKGYGTLENTSCQYCHNNAGGYEPGHPQNDGAADVAVNASATMTYFQNLASGNDDTCSGVSCHSNGLSSGAKVGTATWNTATAGACTECHSTVPSGLPPTGNHTRHYTTEGYSCAECHGTNADAGNQTGHKTNGAIDINFTNVTGSINASNTCSVYCHSPNPNDIKPKPTWNTSSVSCGDCHSIPPTITRNNVNHTTDTNCNGCHGANATLGTQTGHINGVIDTPTMSCVSCHSQPPSGTTRYNMTGAHDLHKSKGYGTLENTSCQYCHNNAGGYELGHPQNDGAADVAVNASATMTYFQNLASGNDDTCSGVSCHSNGLSSGAKVGTATWNTASAGACTECHSTVPSGLPPTGNHTRHYTTEGYSCAECHGTNADAGNQTGHRTNGAIDINFTNVTGSINASKTCSVYCHSPNPNDIKPKPTWNTSSVTCGDCHSIPPTLTRTGSSHPAATLAECEGCHGTGASTGNQTGHLNGIVNANTDSCITCHGLNGSSNVKIDPASFGMHINVNSTDGNNNLTNSDCATCHYNTTDMGSNYTVQAGVNVRVCNDCHVNQDVTSPAVSEHYPGANINVTTMNCENCHSNSLNIPDQNSTVNTAMGNVTHYGTTTNLVTPSAGTYNTACNNCHNSAVNKTSYGVVNKQVTIPHTGTGTCDKCHVDGSASDLHNSSLAMPVTVSCKSCHTTYASKYNAPNLTDTAMGGSGYTTCNGGSCHGTDISSSLDTLARHNVDRTYPGTGGSTNTVYLNNNVSLSVTKGTPVEITSMINDANGAASRVGGAEYYIDTDPGQGKGIPMTAADGLYDARQGSWESVIATLDTGSLPDGNHTIYVRGVDIGKQWSTPKNAQLVVQSLGYINVTVTSVDGPVVNADVWIDSADIKKTDINGNYSFAVPTGTYNVTVSKQPTHNDNTSTGVVVTQGDTTLLPVYLQKKPTGIISGTVTNV